MIIMKKKKHRKNKKNKFEKLLDFMKEYAGVITIIISLLAVLFNGVILYLNKASSSDFEFRYITLKIDNDEWFEAHKEESYGNYYRNWIDAPTLNNDINQLINKEKDKVIGYYVTYLVMEQVGEVAANNIKITFRQTKNNNLLEDNLADLKITKEKKEEVVEEINYPFPKNEKLKIPISLCKIDDFYTTGFEECYYVNLKPISIEYNNKYLFSDKKADIRKYIEHGVVVDGKELGGMGSA